MEFKKKDLILKEDKSEEGVIQKVLSKLKGIRDRAKSEVEETRALVRILTHAVRSYAKTREFDLDEKDKEFIKGQSGDVVKNIILMVIAIIPIPIPVTPFLVIFGKKIGIDFIPKQQDIPEKGKKKEKIDEVRVKKKKHIQQTSDEVKRAVKVCVDLSMDEVKKFLKREDVQISIVSIKTITYGKSKLLNQEITLDLTDSEGKDIKLSRSKFIDLSEIFHETLNDMGFNYMDGEYFHFFFEEQEDELYESNHKILFKTLNEQDEPEETNEPEKIEENSLIHQLCDQAIKRKLKASPFCELKKYYEEVTPAKSKLLKAVTLIHRYLVIDGVGLNKGMFPRIVKLSLDSNDPTQSFFVISLFMLDQNPEPPEKDEDTIELKRKLSRYRGRDIVPEGLPEFLDAIKSKAYAEYERSLTQNELTKKSTFLQLEYRCDDDIDHTLLELLKRIKSKKTEEEKEQEFNNIFNKVTNCISQFMSSNSEPIKADAVYDIDEPMTYEGMPVIKKGDYIEIKKMDPEVDSYLSEFFSIFKQSKVAKYYKKGYLELYNYFVDRLFEWILYNGEEYRRKVLDNMSGVIYDENLFVPRDQIDVYWSNVGQRGCAEKRLSLRFRLRPGLKQMVGYVYKPGLGTDSLVKKVVRDLPEGFRERKVCRELHFDLLDVSKDEWYKTKDMVENTKPIKFIVTDRQFKNLMKHINENVKFKKIR